MTTNSSKVTDSFRNHLKYFLENALLVSIIALVANYIFCYLWLSDGLSFGEIMYMSVSTGVIFFVSISFLNIICLSGYYSYCRKFNIIPYKLFIQVLLLSSFISILSLILDFLFSLMDNSISQSYAAGLEKFFLTDATRSDFEFFFNWPFFIQNIFSNLFFIILATWISGAVSKRIFYTKKVASDGPLAV